MADQKLTDLSEVSAPELEDLVYFVEDPAGTPTSRKITLARLLGLALSHIAQGRLTTETGVAVSTSDRTGQGTIYYTPAPGNRVALYDGTRWKLYTFTERSLALSSLTSGKNYDVFLYDNAGTLTLELSAAWTDDVTRADALTTQDGVRVKNGATTRRLIGTIRTTGTTTTEDSAAKRYVWNENNRVRRVLRNATESTASWNYTSTTIRQANANGANQLDYVTGAADTVIEALVLGIFSLTNSVVCAVGVGVDSTTANSAQEFQGSQIISGAIASPRAQYRGYPGLGRHFLAWLEWVHSVSGTVTWYGTETFTVQVGQSGIVGVIEN